MKNALLALMVALGGVSMTACGSSDGPAERAGEEIDEAIEDAEGTVEEAADNIEEAADEAAEEAEPN